VIVPSEQSTTHSTFDRVSLQLVWTTIPGSKILFAYHQINNEAAAAFRPVQAQLEGYPVLPHYHDSHIENIQAPLSAVHSIASKSELQEKQKCLEPATP
jgi:hypothetical protein